MSVQVSLGPLLLSCSAHLRLTALTGVVREWFRLVTQEMFNADNALFTLSVEGNRMQPNPYVPLIDTFDT